MTAATLTLADFLLARIAEDEASAREAEWLRERQGSEFESQYGWAWHSTYVPNGAKGTQFLPGAPSPARVLAECDAKRRIVLLRLNWQTAEATPETEALEGVCRLLALSYADHPNYQQEWRP